MPSPADIHWLPPDTPAVAARCPMCAHAGPHAALAVLPRIARPSSRVLALRCTGCGGVIASPAEVDDFGALGDDPEAFARYYVETGAGIWEMFWPVGLLAGTKTGSLLDVGCGFGFTVDLWRRALQAEATGCDVESYVELGAAALDAPVLRGRAEALAALAGRRFDIVYACEVIEHVAHPQAFIAALAGKLAPDGVLALTTPNASYVAAENDPATVFCALSPGLHGFLFAPEQLAGMLRQAGFEHVVVRTHEARLVAWASRRPLAIDEDPARLRAPYLDYLRRRAGDPAVPAPTGAALRYRLYRERVFDGAWEEASRLRPAVVAWATPPGARADVPASWIEALGTRATLREYTAVAPYVLPAVMTLLGRHAQLGDADPARALGWYDAALLAQERMVRASPIHVMESVHVGWHALWQRPVCAIALRDWARARATLDALGEATTRPSATFAHARAHRAGSRAILEHAALTQASLGRWDDVAHAAGWLSRLATAHRPGEPPEPEASALAASFDALVARCRDRDLGRARTALQIARDAAGSLARQPGSAARSSALLARIDAEQRAVHPPPSLVMSYSISLPPRRAG